MRTESEIKYMRDSARRHSILSHFQKEKYESWVRDLIDHEWDRALSFALNEDIPE